jgi:hypothetical protein
MSQSGDWSAQAADTIESVVESIRSKTAIPLTTVARALVYGIVAGVMGGAALLLLVIGVVRLLDAYLPGNVWTIYAGLGGVFTLAGLFLWSRRRPARKN